MAVKASNEVTLVDQTDIDSLVTWYRLTTSATKPAAPTTTKTSDAVSDWTTAEPTFSAGDATNYLYTVQQTRWKDGACEWGSVQLSSSYEQAKQAWNKANAAVKAAGDVQANLDAAQPFVVDEQTAATRWWRADCPGLTELKDGQQLTIWLSHAHASSTAQSQSIAASELTPTETVTSSYSNVWLKLTLGDGSDTGWIPCYYSGESRLTSHYGIKNAVHLTYRAGVSSAIPRGWWADANYDSNTYGYGYLIYFSGKVSAARGIWQTQLFMEDGEGTYQGICTASDGTITTANRPYNSNATTFMNNVKAMKASTAGFKVASQIYYLNGGSQNKDGTLNGWGAVYTYNSNVVDSRYSFNPYGSGTSLSLVANKPLYLVGTVHSDGLFHLDSTWHTQTPNDESKVYVLVGNCYDTYRFMLAEQNAWLKWDGSALVDYQKWLSDNAQSTADNAAPKSDAVARSQRIYWRATSASGKPSANTTWLSTSGDGYGNWSLSVPKLVKDGASTKYPYLYTAMQSQTVAQQAVGSACSCSAVLIDDTAVVIDGGSLIAGSVTANQIAAGAITAQKLNIGDTANYSALDVSTAAYYGFTYDDTADGRWFTMTNLKRDTVVSPTYDCKGGEKFKISFEVSSSVQGHVSSSATSDTYLNVAVGAICLHETGAGFAWPLTSYTTSSASAPVTAVESIITLNAGARRFTIFIQLNGASSPSMSGSFKIRNLKVYKMTGGELIVDGSITTDKLSANTLTIGNINGLTDTLNGKASSDSVTNLSRTVSHEAGNLITNGSFTNDVQLWAIEGGTRTVENDASYGSHLKCVWTAAGGSTRRIYPDTGLNFTHVSGKKYRLTFYAKADASNTITVAMMTTGQRYTGLDAASITTSWTKFEGTLSANGSGALSFYLGNAGTLYITKVVLVEDIESNAKAYADTKKTEAIAYTDAVEIGGRNLYKSTTGWSCILNGSMSSYSSDYHGKTLTATGNGSTTRMSHIIDETNVDYAISFIVTSSVNAGITIDVCDNAQQGFSVTANTPTKIVCISRPTRAIDSVYHFVDISASVAGTYKFENVKVEKGNKATDWTPAPEDVDADISAAAQTATNYITADSNGIKIHMAGNSTTYQHQTSDATTFYVGSKRRTKIGATGLQVYVDSGNDADLAASFTADGAQIGKSSSFNTLVRSSDFSIRYATDRLFNVSTDGQSVDVYMGGSTKASGTNYTDAKVESVAAYLSDGCTVSGTAILDSDGNATGYTLDANSFVLDAGGNQFESGKYQGIYYATSTQEFGLEPQLTPQSEIPGAPVSIDMGNVHISATKSSISIDALNFSECGGKAIGGHAHAEGQSTAAAGKFSHSEGKSNYAEGLCSHSEGSDTRARGDYSHTEGEQTTASGMWSHAQNLGTIADSDCQTVIGKYNKRENESVYAFIIGNGTGNTAPKRSNALVVDWDGNLIAKGMAGMVQMFAGSTAPTGWLVCDGSAVSRSVYATLFDAIGTTWGAGDGSTTFNLPDLRGRAPIGAGTGSGLTARTLGGKGGTQDAVVPYHNHSVSAVSGAITGGAHTHPLTYKSDAGSGTARARVVPNGSGDTTSNGGAKSNTHTHDLPAHNTNYAGTSGNATGANMQPFAVINFIICTGKTKTSLE